MKLLHVLLNYKKFYSAIRVSWYAMEKHATEECSREIKTCKDLLKFDFN